MLPQSCPVNDMLPTNEFTTQGVHCSGAHVGVAVPPKTAAECLVPSPHLIDAVVASTTEAELVQKLGGVLASTGYISKLAVYGRGANGIAQDGLVRCILSSVPLDPSEELACQRAIAVGRMMTPQPGPKGVVIWAAEVLSLDENPDVVVSLSHAHAANNELIAAWAHFSAVCVATWRLRQEHHIQATEVRYLAALTEIQMEALQCDHIDDACQRISEHVHWLWQCDNVIVGVCDPTHRRCRAVSGSGLELGHVGSECRRLSEAVMQEAMVRGGVSSWPPVSEEDRHALCAHRQFAEHIAVDSLLCVVLRDKMGDAQGALILAGDHDVTQGTAILNWMTAAQRPLAASLRAIHQAQSSLLTQKVAEWYQKVWKRPNAGWMTAIGVALVISLFPMRYRVACDCELQPVIRRFVAAPFDGPLQHTYVEPGDIVTRDQILAVMDGEEIEWELSGVEAELHRAKKEHAGYVATHESGKAQIAEHEVERLRMRSDILKHRIEHLQIKCPMDGIVVSGDLKKSEGMPLKVGQTLFEVAPLQRMTVEVSVPELDVRLVEAESSIDIWLDAFPGHKWQARIAQVHPRSEIKRDDNVFVAEVPLENTDGTMRPGMRGRASIDTVVRPLAWNLLQRPCATAMRWLGW